MNLRPLRPERSSDGSETLQIAEPIDADANRYPNGYPSEPDLMQLVEQLSDRLTAEELASLAGVLAEQAEAIRQ